VDEVRKTTRRSDYTTKPSDEVCSEGHPMVIRLGRNGRFLACSLYPEHKESRPLPGEEAPTLKGEGETCPKCGEGTLTTKRGRFGAFLGCSRYPDCDYIQREGPPPPDQLPFEVTCPKNGDGQLIARRARRTGNVFWGCSAYPKCDFTTNNEPIGAIHDVHDDGKGAAGMKGMAGKSPCAAQIASPGMEWDNYAGVENMTSTAIVIANNVIEQVGNTQLVFSTDYPHVDSRYLEEVNHFLKLPLTDTDKRKILWDNCAAYYAM